MEALGGRREAQAGAAARVQQAPMRPKAVQGDDQGCGSNSAEELRRDVDRHRAPEAVKYEGGAQHPARQLRCQTNNVVLLASSDWVSA